MPAGVAPTRCSHVRFGPGVAVTLGVAVGVAVAVAVGVALGTGVAVTTEAGFGAGTAIGVDTGVAVAGGATVPATVTPNVPSVFVDGVRLSLSAVRRAFAPGLVSAIRAPVRA